jgi:beta-phosphoglucomutase-like phosphatase (HAD superfamily)
MEPLINSISPDNVRVILCDADGTLFPSEEHAYEASAKVTQEFAARYGLTGDFSAEALRHSGTGRNFRSMTRDLLRTAGVGTDDAELEKWIERERVEVTAHLGAVLTPDEEVRRVVGELGRRFRLAVVSSSALPRLATCFTATGLDEYFPIPDRFSAEDDLRPPASKPDPAIYRHALSRLGLQASEAVAVEDAVAGVQSACAAGVPTIGLTAFVPPGERAQRVRDLHDAGASTVLDAWSGVLACFDDVG